MYSKKSLKSHKKESSRKSKPAPDVYLLHLQKQKGGRLANLTTFKPVCSSEGASAKLKAIKTLKAPDESDEFIHVLKSMMDDKELIVKIQEPGRMVDMEIAIQKRLEGCNNIIRHICHVQCLLDISWNKPLEAPRFLCDSSGIPKIMLIMEYINNDLAKFLGTNSVPTNVLYSLVKQAGFAMIEFHIHKYVCHNDINRGNILLHSDSPKNILYTFHNHDDYVVNTYGYEVIFIDFQRGNIFDIDFHNNSKNDSIVFQLARDEISLMYELMSKWTPQLHYANALRELMNSIMKSTSTDEMIALISGFSIAV
jgi:serine/threonine protein kinase